MTTREKIESIIGSKGKLTDFCQGLGAIACDESVTHVQALLESELPGCEVTRLHSGSRLEIRI